MRWILLACFFASLSLPIAFQQGMLGLLLAVVAFRCWQEKRLPTTLLDRSLLFLFGAFLLSTLFCPDVSGSLVAYRKLWLVGAFFVTAILLEEPSEAEQLLKLFIGCAAIVAAYGIVQHFTGLDISKQLVGKKSTLDPFWFGRQEGFRTKGFHPSGISYAHNLLFPLTLVSAWLSAPGLPWRRWIMFAGMWGLMVFALLFSLTRGVWIAYVCVLFLLGLIKGGRALTGVIGGAVLLGFFLLSAGPGVQERAQKALDIGENLGRSQIWLANIAMMKERPWLGWGYGNYRQFREPFYRRYPQADHTGHAHNSFLQIWVESGLLGLIAFLSFFWVLVQTGWKTYQLLPPEAEPLRSMALGAMLSILGFLIGGLTQHNFGDAEVVIVMWAVAGVMVRMREWAGKGGKSCANSDEYRANDPLIPNS
jgi:O-antigen ligase